LISCNLSLFNPNIENPYFASYVENSSTTIVEKIVTNEKIVEKMENLSTVFVDKLNGRSEYVDSVKNLSPKFVEKQVETNGMLIV
jgi:hypothetical protein